MPKYDPIATPAPKASVPKAKASESGDPAIQYLIAHRYTYILNGDTKGAQDVDKQLAELGFA